MAMTTAQSENKAQTLIEFTSIHNPLKCKAIHVNYVKTVLEWTTHCPTAMKKAAV